MTSRARPRSSAIVSHLVVTTLAVGCLVAVPARAEVGSEQNPNPKLRLVSQSPDGASGDGASVNPRVSSRSPYVVFESAAADLVPDDDNGLTDVFLHHYQNGTTALISHAPDGGPANGWSRQADVSDDGRFVVFISNATNLVEGGTSGNAHAFVLDRVTGVIDVVTRSVDGDLSPDTNGYEVRISGDGTHVAFSARGKNLVAEEIFRGVNVYVRDLETSTTTLVSEGWGGGPADWHSGSPSINEDGRFVAFDSDATNLTEVTDPTLRPDVFLRDLQTGITQVVTRTPGGAEPDGDGSSNPDITADGQQLVFRSTSSDLLAEPTSGVDVMMHDVSTGETTLISRRADGKEPKGTAEEPSISADGRYVSFTSGAALLPGTVSKQDYVYRFETSTARLRFVMAPDDLAHKRLAGDSQVNREGSVLFSSKANLVVGDTNGEDYDVYFRRIRIT